MIEIKFPSKPFTINSLFASLSKRAKGAPITRPGLFIKIKRAVAAGVLVTQGQKDKPKVKGKGVKGRRSTIYALANQPVAVTVPESVEVQETVVAPEVVEAPATVDKGDLELTVS
jgi:hypothetical protein